MPKRLAEVLLTPKQARLRRKIRGTKKFIGEMKRTLDRYGRWSEKSVHVAVDVAADSLRRGSEDLRREAEVIVRRGPKLRKLPSRGAKLRLLKARLRGRRVHRGARPPLRTVPKGVKKARIIRRPY